MRADLLTEYGLRFPTPQGLPFMSGQEFIEELLQNFHQSPLSYQTDPATGRTIVTRDMEKPIGPVGLDPPYQNLAMSPTNPSWNQNSPNLRSSWILPAGAMTEPKFIDRSAAPSDAERQGAYLSGISNVGAETSTLNPLTHWPESTFRVPLRTPNIEDPYALPEPVFGGTVDFSEGRYHVPPTPGQWSQPYGPLGGAQGTSVPGWGSEMIPPIQSTDYEEQLRRNILRRSTSL